MSAARTCCKQATPEAQCTLEALETAHRTPARLILRAAAQRLARHTPAFLLAEGAWSVQSRRLLETAYYHNDNKMRQLLRFLHRIPNTA